jgi:uncharacterized membrane protein
MIREVTVGLGVIAGIAVLEAALIPGVVIGGAAVLAPKYLPRLRRRLQPAFDSIFSGSKPAAAASDGLAAKLPLAVPETLKIGQAVAKTITFRIIATTLDFTTNYLVIGELGAAAGLSSFALVFGPLFYLTHEAAWNHFGPSGTAAEDPNPRSLGPGVKVTLAGRGITVGRALAKTITFRAIVTVTDFTANYVVVGDLLTAAGLTAVAFVFGPFIYLGHEMLWDRFGSRADRVLDRLMPTKLLPAPA